MLRWPSLLILCWLLAACSQQLTLDNAVRSDDNAMPADLSGSWERDYWRGDDVNRTLDRWFRQLARSTPDQRLPGYPSLDNPGALISPQSVASILALAGLATLKLR